MKNSHVLQQKFGFSLQEINNMVPWEFDVRMDLIIMDQEKEKEERRKQGSQQW